MSFGYIAQARLGTDLLDCTHRSIYTHTLDIYTHTLKNEKTCLELQCRLAERWVALIFCEQCRKTFPASLSESVCRIHIHRSSFSDATLRSSVVCTCHMLLFTHAPSLLKKKKEEKSKIYLIIVHLFQSLYHSDVFLNIGLFWQKRNTRQSGSHLSLGAANAQAEISPAENNASAQEQQSLNDFSPVQVDACV